MTGLTRLQIAFVVFVCAAQVAHAHMYLNSIIPQGGAESSACVWPHPTDGTGDSPVSDKNSKRFDTTTDMICGLPTTPPRAAASTCALTAGSTVSLQWWHATPNDDVVDASHRGPCSVWMANTANSATGAGSVWFKIYEEGYNAATSQFCNDRIRADGPNKGRVTVTIPADLAAGTYLLRGETWALHEGYTAYGAQPYVGCATVTVAGSGKATPPTTNIVGLFKPNDPALMFNIYGTITSYPLPAASVPVYKAGAVIATTGAKPAVTTGAKPASTTGAQPASTTGAVCPVGTIGCACNPDNTCGDQLLCTVGVCQDADAVSDAPVVAATVAMALAASLAAVL